jgi:hypothetical protein
VLAAAHPRATVELDWARLVEFCQGRLCTNHASPAGRGNRDLPLAQVKVRGERVELAGHIRAFATMMCSLRGQDLEAWMADADSTHQLARREPKHGQQPGALAVRGRRPTWVDPFLRSKPATSAGKCAWA